MAFSTKWGEVAHARFGAERTIDQPPDPQLPWMESQHIALGLGQAGRLKIRSDGLRFTLVLSAGPPIRARVEARCISGLLRSPFCELKHVAFFTKIELETTNYKRHCSGVFHVRIPVLATHG